MKDFLNNEVVQFVLAICTFLGGIVGSIQFAGYLRHTTEAVPHEPIESQATEAPTPKWVQNEGNIVKKGG
jgi:hypothetical protein